MVNEEVSGAVKIFFHTTAAGTGLPSERFFPYSTRQSRTFIVSQKAANSIKMTLEIMPGFSRQIQRLPNPQAPRFYPGVGSHQGVHPDAILPCNRRERLAAPDHVRAPGSG